METRRLVAVTGCLGSDGVLRRTGETWDCPADEAGSLIAAGAARAIAPKPKPAVKPKPKPAAKPKPADPEPEKQDSVTKEPEASS